MTYAMKIEEERELAEEKGREEGRKELTEKFFKLFSCIRESGNEKDFELATSDPNSLPGLYLKYGIS